MWIGMMLAATSAVGSAQEAQQSRCPDPALAVRSAEQDAVSYFLRDAELALTEAIAGMGCGPRAPKEVLAPFWITRGAIWSFLDDERADAAFAAATAADPAYFNGDFGDAIHERWQTATPPIGGPGNLQLRGLGEGDWVAIDGVDTAEPWPVTPGFHLVQVGSLEQARFARLLDIEAGAEVTVVIPEDGGSAPTMQLAGNTAFSDVAGPIRRQGRKYVDANDQPLSWRLQVQPIAAADAGGRGALQLYRSNFAAGVGTGVLGGAAAYTTYVVAWDATTGHNLEPGVSWTLTGAGALAVGGSAFLASRLWKRHKTQRDAIEAAANRTLGGRSR